MLLDPPLELGNDLRVDDVCYCRLQAWIAASGVERAAVVRDCITAGIVLSAMDVVLDSAHVKQRLRGGESTFSITRWQQQLVAYIRATVLREDGDAA
ncbi:hypothetical protein [Streptomyces sp. IBSBF 3352]|uniref:hypothetical protein n=1 Tax=Streptomyces sp. IBSBF 3352 TaxID=2903523 RepID=UPI002FDBF197